MAIPNPTAPHEPTTLPHSAEDQLPPWEDADGELGMMERRLIGMALQGTAEAVDLAGECLPLPEDFIRPDCRRVAESLFRLSRKGPLDAVAVQIDLDQAGILGREIIGDTVGRLAGVAGCEPNLEIARDYRQRIEEAAQKRKIYRLFVRAGHRMQGGHWPKRDLEELRGLLS